MRAFRASLMVHFMMAAVAAQIPSRLPDDLIDQIDSRIEHHREQAQIPGMSVAVAIDGSLAYSKAFGFSDLENRVRATTATVYRTASIAKPMTAVAVMQLAEQGKLDLDQSIERYCPSFPAKQWPVTARQLLAHLGGIRHYRRGQEATGKEHFTSVAQALDLFKNDPLLHKPGSQFRYSTYGYNLLGCAVEGASGQEFGDYMQSHVFHPAGMRETTVDNVYAVIPHRARGYTLLDQSTYDTLPAAYQAKVELGTVYNAALHDTSMKIPGGGLLSTAEDLIRFALSVRNRTLVSEDSVARMWTPQETSQGETVAYGLGWALGEVDGQLQVGHSGGQAGTTTLLIMLPDKGLAVAVMCNLQRAPIRTLVRELRGLLLPAAAAP